MASLHGQLAQSRHGIALATRAVTGDVKTPKARRRIAKIEHRGDQDRAELIRGLSRTLSSPIDREDLFRLSRAIDNILDGTRDFIREHDLFACGPRPELAEVLDAIDDGIVLLGEAVDSMIEAPRRIRVKALAAKKTGVRGLYQRELAKTLKKPVNSETLKVMELLRRLDGIGLTIADAADILADGAMKRSQ